MVRWGGKPDLKVGPRDSGKEELGSKHVPMQGSGEMRGQWPREEG